jgi:hypothetical protein
MAEDLRASIEAAMDGDSGGDAAPEVDTIVDTPDEGTAPEAAEKPAVEGRDSLGRFLKKDEPADPAAAPAPTELAAAPAAAPAQAPAAEGAPVAVPPPQSWGAVVREKWATLPPEVQQHIAQRETQMQRWANETAPLRQTGEQFMQAIQPFQHAITAEGVDPITAVRNLMQVGTTLRFGTPMEKATTIARMVKAYGVDIRGLDDALAGEVPQGGGMGQGLDPGAVQAMVQQQLAPLYQAAQQRQQQAQVQAVEAARSELSTFAQGKEFIGDVREMMADMIEVSERQGMTLSLQDAYDRACMLHPDVSRVIMARQQGNAAQGLTAAARKARASAVSVKGGAPVGNPERAEPSSIRDSIEAAIEAHSRV